MPGLLLGLLLPGLAAAQAFEPPARFVESRELGLGPSVLYPRMRFAGLPGTATGLLLWTEKRFGTDPFQIDLFGKRLHEDGSFGADQYLLSLRDQLLPDGAEVWLESAQRVHIVYATRADGESRLVHRLTDLSLSPGAEQVLDRSALWLGQPQLAALAGGRLAVLYRRGSDLLYVEAPSSRPPLLLVREARPLGLALAAAGRSSFAAYAVSRWDGSSARQPAAVELIELRDGTVAGRQTLAESPARIGNLASASSAGGRVAFAWVDDRYSVPQLNNSEIYLRLREPDGRWQPEQRVSYTLAESFLPALAWDAQERLHLLWEDAALGAFEILHTTADRQDGFDVVSPPDGQASVLAAAAIVGGRLAVVWRDALDNRSDVFLSRELPDE